MRSFSHWPFACILGVSSLATLAAFGPTSAPFTDAILEIHADSLTDYKLSSATNFQDIQLDHRNRGVLIEGSVQARPLFPMAFAGNPFESAWRGNVDQNGLHLEDGHYAPQDVDIALPSEGPAWPIGRSYNARQWDGSAYVTSNGPQGRNWFQDSRPEIAVYKVNGAMGAEHADDVLYLIYRADAFVEFNRVGDTKSFKATNGAAGSVVHEVGSPDTYLFTDMGGVEYTFFGFNTAKTGADGQLWKIEDNGGDVAYVGDATTASTAVTNGFDGAGQVTTAYDGSGRRYTYTYTTLDSVDRLTQVKAEINDSGWQMVAQVDYEYYTTETYGDPGALKLVEITEPQTDSGITVVKKKYYRYWEGTFDDSTNPGHPHAIQYVVGFEGTRKFDWSDQDFDEDFLSASESIMKPYASLYLEYDSSHRVDKGWFNGNCGCGGASNGVHNFTYGTNGSYSDGSGYDTAWATRTVVERPDGTYLTQYFDEAHQSMALVTTDSDPSTGTPDTWVQEGTRGSDGLVTAVYTPESIASYTHSTGAITHEASAGLVRTFTRETSGTTTGYVLNQKHKKGTSGTAYFDRAWEYDEAQKATLDTTVVRPYQDKVTVYTEEITSGSSGAVDTTMALTFYSGTLAVEKETTTLAAVSGSKNGEAATVSRSSHFRMDGRVDFTKSVTAVIDYTEWSGGLSVKQIRDADTSKTGAGEDFETVSVPTGFSSSGSNIRHDKMTAEYDKYGKLSKQSEVKVSSSTDALQYRSRLADHRQVHLRFADEDGNDLFGPVQYTVLNHAGQVEAQGKIALTGNSIDTSSYPLTGHVDETDDDPITAIDQGTLCALATSLYDNAGTTLQESRQYHDIPASGVGTVVTNYDRTLHGYDDMGRRTRAKDPTDTIDRTVYDALGRVIESYVGTNDSGFAGGEPSGTDNMVKTESRVYDAGVDGGNGLLTQVTRFVEDGTTDQRVTEFTYDYQGRLLLEQNPTAPHALHEYDNQGRRTATAQYSSTANVTAGTTDPNAAGTQTDRMTLNETFYDERGLVWKTVRHAVDQDDGSDDDTLEALYWFDQAGRQIKMDGEQLTKTFYDRNGRSTHRFVLAVDNDSVYADMDDVSGDIVLEESQTIYDEDDGLVLATARIDRHHDDYGGGETTGALDTNADTDDDKWTAADIAGRIQITAFWYDQFDRKTDEVRYGTNGGSTFDVGALTSTPPARSDTALRTTYSYNDDGELEAVEDPKGIVAKFEHDDLGRRTKEIRNYDGSVNSGEPSGTADNQTVVRAYEDGLLKTLTADVPSGGTDQVTTYIYGVTDADSPGPSKFASNRLLREVQYPDKASASDVVRNAYNVQSEGTWVQDQAGNVFEMVKDDSGREIHKRVSTLASGFDGAVRRISTTYDGLGRRSLVTQYDNAAVGSGSVTDEVRFTYTDWGLIDAFEQDRNSAVDASGSVDDYEVSYLYEKATGGRNTIRKTRMVTPHGKNTNYDYLSTGDLHDDDASRVTRVKRNTLELAAYSYNGVGHLVGTAYQQPEMMSNLYDGSGYPDLDRFNRVTTSKWTKDLATDIDFVHVDVAYDRNSNITGTVDTVHVDLNATADQPKFDVLYTMDDLDRLTKEEVGELSGAAIINDQRQQEWTLDHLGNWDIGKLDLNADGDWSDADEYNDDRTHNAVNELTARDTDDDGSDDFSLTYDDVGNLTDDAEDYEYTYDPFGRLRKIEDQGASVVLAEYAYNGLGFMISELADTDDDGDADANDKWFHTAYDERWRALCVYREDDSSPKIEYINQNAGGGGFGGSSYIDGLLQRRRDTSTDWATDAGDGTYEEHLYYCQNWRHDVVAITDFRGGVHEWIKYSAYGVPIGLPGGDDDVSGATDATDLTRIQDRVDGTTGWNYSVLADLDLDGDVEADDKTEAQNYEGVNTGWAVLSTEEIANNRGFTACVSRHAWTWSMRRRELDSRLGTWRSRDPLDYVDGLTLYQFVRSNPVRYVDPAGARCSGAPAGQAREEVTSDRTINEGREGQLASGVRCPGDDENCCRYAEFLGLDRGSAGGIVCCDGRKVICVWKDKSDSPEADELMAACIRIHERYHLAEVDCVDNTGALPYRPKPRAGTDVDAREIEAYRIEEECLEGAARACHSAACSDAVADRLHFLGGG